MSQSLVKSHLHLVFSTRARTPWLKDHIRPELHGYLAGVLSNLQSPAKVIGGVEDHVHCLFSLSKNLSLGTNRIASSSGRRLRPLLEARRSLPCRGRGGFVDDLKQPPRPFAADASFAVEGRGREGGEDLAQELFLERDPRRRDGMVRDAGAEGGGGQRPQSFITGMPP